MSRQRHQSRVKMPKLVRRLLTKVEMPKLVRLLLGLIITVIGYRWSIRAHYEGLFFQSLFCTGFITSIVAGLPLGWMLTAGCILVWHRFDIILLDAVLNGQIEPPIFIGAFVITASAGGLSGWGITILIQGLLRLILRN